MFKTLLALAAALVYGACQAHPATRPETPLGRLTVAPVSSGAHYARRDWGDGSTQGGCTTRRLVLIRQGAGAAKGKSCTPLCPAGPCSPGT